jgi:predicted SAM-dependent methyltransferase
MARAGDDESMADPLSPRLLHLGCGLCAPVEWINVDGSTNAWLAQRPILKKLAGALRLVPRGQLDIPWPTNITIANLRKRLPFQEASLDAVYSSHTLEHLYRNEALALLRESVRVLKPGGICRMLVPDLGALIREYRGEGSAEGHGDTAEGDPARRLCQKLLMRVEQSPRRGLIYSMYTARTDFHTHKWMYDGPSLVKVMTEAGLTEVRERGFRDSGIPHIDKVEAPGRVLNGAGVAAEGIKP